MEDSIIIKSQDSSDSGIYLGSQDTVTTLETTSVEHEADSLTSFDSSRSFVGQSLQSEFTQGAERVHKILKGFSIRKHRLSIRVVLAVLICSGIYTCAEKSLNSDTVTFENDNSNQTSKSAHLELLDASVFRIKSYDDLLTIAGYPRTIEIISLTSPIILGEVPRKGYLGTVNELKVSGPITEEWLTYLVSFFPKLDTIHLNINGLCQGSNEKRRSDLKSIYLEEVLYLSIEESKLCSIINWVFKWNLPRVRAIKLNKIDFTRRAFKGFCSFLNGSQEMIESVEMRDCKLCDDCDMSQIPERIQTKLIVTKGRK